MEEYLVAKQSLTLKSAVVVWIVSKWEGGGEPSQVYEVTSKNNKITCSCPSGLFHGYCKHTDMVKKEDSDVQVRR